MARRRVSNDPRKRPGQLGKNRRDPSQHKTLETRLKPDPKQAAIKAGAGPGATPEAPLAERVLHPHRHGDDLGKISAVKMILAGMDDAGARKVDISTELAQAIPVVAAQLITGTSKEPATASSKHAGAKLVLGSLRYNLARFEEANKTEPSKVENTLNIQANGQTTFIIPAPVIARLGDAPTPRQ